MSPEDMQRYGVDDSGVSEVWLSHTGCDDNWMARLDAPVTLAELVQRAEEHGEVCR